MNAPPDLRFDPASAGDIDTLLAMTRAFHRDDSHPLDAAGEQAVARIARGEPCVRAWIARREGEATGYVVITLGYSIEYGGRDGFIDDLYVVPVARGLGVGRQLIAFALREAGTNALWRSGTLHLEVEVENENALHAY